MKERAAIQSVNRTVSSMQQSIRGAGSPDRDPAVLSEASDLSRALLQPETLTARPLRGRRDVGGTQLTLDVRDITYADGERLLLRSDVLDSAGVECVEYRVVTTTSGERELVQNVWRNAAPPAPPACPGAGAPATTQTLITAVGGN